MNTRRGLGGISRALSNRDYRLYWIGLTGSAIGSWAYRTATGWLAWSLTGSTAALGIVVFAEVIPAFFLGPIAGAAVDRLGALWTTRVVQLTWALQATVTTALTFAGLMTVELLVLLAFLQGFINAFNNPSHLALIAALVPREELAPAVALQSATVQGARFVGPAIAGGIIAGFEANGGTVIGVGWTYVMNVLTYILFFAMLLMVSVKETRRGGRLTDGIFTDIIDGVRYTVKSFPIRTILLLTVIMALFLRAVFELYPSFADQVFGRGADGLAWLLSVGGICGMISSLWIARRGEAKGLTKYFAAFLIVGAIALVGFVLTDNFWIAVALSGVLGFSANTVSISAQTLIQTVVPHEMRARVMSLVGLTFRAVPATGALILGLVAEKLGLVWPLIFGAAITVAAAVWMIALIRQRNLAGEAEALNSP